ncbi:DUF397 domain-containing protein [Kitasatospora sp. NPDC127116]|uniref:DUF397 domain-containing protein n=1 Tax=Kitasatospora sp. NPDC127116 TaxID=3345367 RepID=UPI0036441E8A
MRAELTWRKSSYSGGSSTECVEIAETTEVFVRDSKDPQGPNLTFEREAWGDFVSWAASLEI